MRLRSSDGRTQFAAVRRSAHGSRRPQLRRWVPHPVPRAGCGTPTFRCAMSRSVRRSPLPAPAPAAARRRMPGPGTSRPWTTRPEYVALFIREVGPEARLRAGEGYARSSVEAGRPGGSRAAARRGHGRAARIEGAGQGRTSDVDGVAGARTGTAATATGGCRTRGGVGCRSRRPSDRSARCVTAGIPASARRRFSAAGVQSDKILPTVQRMVVARDSRNDRAELPTSARATASCLPADRSSWSTRPRRLRDDGSTADRPRRGRGTVTVQLEIPAASRIHDASGETQPCRFFGPPFPTCRADQA
jgi:hypothetical protein